MAAGNDNQDACNVSPGSTPEAMTVAASASGDARAGYSNYGTCVDLYAPGSSITSAGLASSTATSIRSGTSMASPHVAGMAALFKATYGDASSSVLSGRLLALTTAGAITGNPAGTPNQLLYKSSFWTRLIRATAVTPGPRRRPSPTPREDA
ncbi:S8 family serine peptidase [Longimicrobium sp.]|uniref:S8 family serine peptidase n=1 Tax=Longimicrobium sp. TaxID=2029185 RepID=UPI0039C9C779